MNIHYEINKLLHYGLIKELISEEDFFYSANQIINLLKLNDFVKMDVTEDYDFYHVLDNLLDYAYENKLFEYNSVDLRDVFDSQLMNCLMPRPSEINRQFWSNYQKDKSLATNFYYQLSIYSNYIRLKRTNKNIIWKSKTNYGELDITINLSKPEKDPLMIAKAKTMPKLSYPKCLLCVENEGYSGHMNHPGRSNHRMIKLKLNHENYYLQYSPYVYYNEHCIVLKEQHEPMKINKDTFIKLLEFVTLFPHYFLGSNADLPIVGGSILDHDHFQGGNYVFPMMKQTYLKTFIMNDFKDIEIGIVNWPMSVLLLKSRERDRLVECADQILSIWKAYNDPNQDIIAFTNNEPHNTITPIARLNDGIYELYLVLRNNRTTKEHPLGLFHPHNEHHHIKKENIGLIEVMGLAVLPARLKEEIEQLKHIILEDEDYTTSSYDLSKHKNWVESFIFNYSKINDQTIDQIIKTEIGIKFQNILSQCGVFKNSEAWDKFIKSIN